MSEVARDRQEPAVESDRPPVIVLAAAKGQTERELIQDWLAPGEGPDAQLFVFERQDGPSSADVARLVASLDDDRVILAPVRVAWLAPEHGGRRVVEWRDLLSGNDPRYPSERLKRRLVALGETGRWVIAEAESAALSTLRARWKQRTGGGIDSDFAGFVARQAELALERAEVRVQGRRYKAPRIAPEDVAATPGYREGLARLATDLGQSEAELRAEAAGYLHELRTERSPLVLDLIMRFFRWAYSRAYGEIDLIEGQVAALGPLMARYPALILPSHKANLDAPIVDTVLWEHGLPPPTLFAGINMSFWPMGPLMRKAGRIFVRRGIADNPVYRFALREYLAYMIERRFSLEWFPEGTRSRTGKLLPPKLGLMTYVVDAYRQGRIEDVKLVPVALVYDQVYETADFIREARGEAKPAESLRWMLSYLRALRRPYGKAYLRVGEPLSMREALGPPDPGLDPKSPEALLAMQKLALAVSWRTNQVTPITGIALVSFALLATGGRAVPRARLERYAALAVAHARTRNQPLADSARLDEPGKLGTALDALIGSGVVVLHDTGHEMVYGIGGGQHIAAAFYRNSMLHFVLDRAIGELAVLSAASTAPKEREEAFFAAAVRSREALKFEFFFRERPAFERAMGEEMDLIAPDWREMLRTAAMPETAFRAIFGGVGTAHSALRAFVEAYSVVAELLVRAPLDVPADRQGIVSAACGLGRQYLLERKLCNAESVSRPLFATALELAANLHLTEPGPDLAERRGAFRQRLLVTLATLEMIETITRETLEA
ncbi:MAG: glycerol-3-phosphate 1-O-acyltransferase [Novosphingobium sp.]|nr:glycerol-3-phosphate 1-O-acyltransferase [Novosphingobium sp.]